MIAATTDALLTVWRGEVSDVASDVPLWTDDEGYNYMSEAADKVAKDVEGGYRLTNVAITALEPLVRISPNILHIREIRVVSDGKMLTPMNYNEATNQLTSDYGIAVTNVVIGRTGSLMYYCRDYAPGKLLLSPAPVVDDVLEIQCTVTIAIPLIAGMIVPLPDTTDQRLILTWMKVLAYEKQDADTSDMKRSDRYRAIYKQEMLDRKSALRSYRRAPRPIQMDW